MRKLLLGIAPATLIIALWVFVDQSRDRFPDPIASHWGLSGQPDGFSDLDTHLVWSTAALVLVWAIWFLVAVIKLPRAIRVLFLLITGYLFAILFLLMLQTFVSQLDVLDASEVALGLEFLLLLIPVFLLIPVMLSKPSIEVSEKLVVRLAGFPFLKLGYHEISAASESEVRAGDFGGWGIRYANKTTAFVPSSGKALKLELVDGSKILIRSDSSAELVDKIETRRQQ